MFDRVPVGDSNLSQLADVELLEKLAAERDLAGGLLEQPRDQADLGNFKFLQSGEPFDRLLIELWC